MVDNGAEFRSHMAHVEDTQERSVRVLRGSFAGFYDEYITPAQARREREEQEYKYQQAAFTGGR